MDPAEGLVCQEIASADGQRAAHIVRDAAAEAAAAEAGAAAADRLVAAQRTITEDGNSLIEEGASIGRAGVAATEPVAALRHVVGEHTVEDAEAGGAAVENAAPSASSPVPAWPIAEPASPSLPSEVSKLT